MTNNRRGSLCLIFSANIIERFSHVVAFIHQLSAASLVILQSIGYIFKMSRTPGDGEGPSKIRALEEVVGLLKKHIHQRESEINGLGNQLRQSNEKIKMLEQKLKDKNQVWYLNFYSLLFFGVHW